MKIKALSDQGKSVTVDAVSGIWDEENNRWCTQLIIDNKVIWLEDDEKDELIRQLSL